MPAAEPVREITRGDRVRSVAFSPDGRRLAVGSDDKTATVRDIATGTVVHEITRGDSVRSVAYSPDGKHLVSGSNDNTVKVWDSQTGKEVIVLLCHRPIVCSCVH